MTTAAPVKPMPVSVKPVVPPVVDPKAPVVPAAEVKEVDPLEKELAEKWGEDWEKASPRVRERTMEAERKVREADKRFQQIAKIQKDYDLSKSQMAQLVELIKRDPWAVLENPALSLDPDRLAEERVWKKIQREQMDPKDREIADFKAREAARLKADEEAKTAQQREADKQATEAAKAKFKTMIDAAIAEEKLPNTQKVVQQIAYYMRLQKVAGKEIDMKACAAATKKDFIDWTGQFIEGQPDDQLLTSIPKGVIDKLRKADLAALRAAGLAPKPGPKPAGSKKEERPKETPEEWRERMRAARGR
jgi:hypothetical protein